MALVSTGFFLHIALVDHKSNVTEKIYELTAADYTAAVAAQVAIITQLNGVTEGKIASTDIREHFAENALVLPTDVAIASEYVSVTARIAGAGDRKANYTIPMPKEAIMSGNNLIVTNAAVQTYNAIYQSGNQAFISQGELLASGDPLKGKRTTRYRRFE